jgi:hypothetical protein
MDKTDETPYVYVKKRPLSEIFNSWHPRARYSVYAAAMWNVI